MPPKSRAKQINSSQQPFHADFAHTLGRLPKRIPTFYARKGAPRTEERSPVGQSSASGQTTPKGTKKNEGQLIPNFRNRGSRPLCAHMASRRTASHARDRRRFPVCSSRIFILPLLFLTRALCRCKFAVGKAIVPCDAFQTESDAHAPLSSPLKPDHGQTLQRRAATMTTTCARGPLEWGDAWARELLRRPSNTNSMRKKEKRKKIATEKITTLAKGRQETRLYVR